jgi:carbamoyl-phosphate synthase large subunit
MKPRRILITGGGGAGNQALWRLLHTRYELHFADAQPDVIDPAIPADRRVAIPLADNPDFVSTLARICRERRIDLVVPCVDEELPLLAAAVQQGKLPEVLLGSGDFVATMLDKLAFARALQTHGLAVPRTGLADEAAAWRFPLILKPRSGRGSRGVMRIEHPAQIPAYLILQGTVPAQVVAQECIAGQEYTVFVLADRHAQLRAVVPVRVDSKRGVTIRAATEAHPAITAYAARFQAAFRPTGPYNIQCMVTPAGEVLPFEVNPRVSTTFCLAIAAGVDPFALYADETVTAAMAAFAPGLRLTRHWHNEIQPSTAMPTLTTHESTALSVRGQPKIGTALRPYIMAEVGTNHNRDLATARTMLREIAAAGCDCAKFQIYEPDEIVSAGVRASAYGLDKLYGDISAREMFGRHLQTPKEWFPELRDYCHELGMDFSATIHGPHGLRWAEQVGLDVVKIASMDHNNLPFLRSLVNRLPAPILVSFGMAQLPDIDATVKALAPHGPGAAFFHCCAVYPPKPEELRLGNLPFLAKRHGAIFGFSDHAMGVEAALAARAAGAVLFEKHITLDRRQSGPDHPFAMQPEEFAEYIATLRATPLGRPKVPAEFVPPAARELRNRSEYLKSIIIRRDLPAGHRLTSDDVYLARPASGIPPGELDNVLGRVLTRPVAAEEILQWDRLTAAVAA